MDRKKIISVVLLSLVFCIIPFYFLYLKTNNTTYDKIHILVAIIYVVLYNSFFIVTLSLKKQYSKVLILLFCFLCVETVFFVWAYTRTEITYRSYKIFHSINNTYNPFKTTFISNLKLTIATIITWLVHFIVFIRSFNVKIYNSKMSSK